MSVVPALHRHISRYIVIGDCYRYLGTDAVGSPSCSFTHSKHLYQNCLISENCKKGRVRKKQTNTARSHSVKLTAPGVSAKDKQHRSAG